MAMIREHRDARQLTQAGLAKLAGVSRSLLAEWETGAKVPNEARLRALADALGTTVPGLFSPPGAESSADLDAAISARLAGLSAGQKVEALRFLDYLEARRSAAAGNEETRPSPPDSTEPDA